LQLERFNNEVWKEIIVHIIVIGDFSQEIHVNIFSNIKKLSHIYHLMILETSYSQILKQ